MKEENDNANTKFNIINKNGGGKLIFYRFIST